MKNTRNVYCLANGETGDLLDPPVLFFYLYDNIKYLMFMYVSRLFTQS